MSITDLGTLRIVPLADIIPDIPSRGRKIYTGIEDLAESIKSQGLISPLTVYSPNGEPPYKLLAGGRRFLACTQLKLELVSVRIYDHPLSDQEFRILELFENTKRKDLDFAEQIAMTTEINNLFVEMKGPKTSRHPDASGHSLRDTAKMLGRSQASVQQDVKLAEFIAAVPELGLDKAKNKSAAMHAMRRMGQAIKVQTTNVSNPRTQLADSYTIGDFFGNKLSPGSYNFIEVDPPYGIDLHQLKSAEDKQVLDSQYVEVSPEKYSSFIFGVCQECYRLAAEDSWIVFWHGPQWYNAVHNSMKIVGFVPNTIPAIWKKGNNPGQTMQPSIILGNAYELFTYARKGKPKIITLGRSNIFDFAVVPPQQKIHPTERPAELLADIISTFCWPRSNILVPFAGSGTTLIEGDKLGHNVVGFDLSDEFKQSFLRRITSE